MKIAKVNKLLWFSFPSEKKKKKKKKKKNKCNYFYPQKLSRQ